MKQVLKMLIAIFSMSYLASVLAATTPQSNEKSDVEVVKQIVSDYMQKYDIPGIAVELYIDGKPQNYYFGYADKEKKTPVTGQTIFEVGSITKLMTSLLLAQQIDSATVQLDNSVTEYLSDLPPELEDISLGNLATHTSGLPFNKKAGEVGLIPEYPADEKWVYSNAGIELLGNALEKITHKSIPQLFYTRIFEPLKMSAFSVTVPKRYEKFLAQGYGVSGEPAPHEGSAYPAAGAVKLSGQDMQRFLSASIGLAGTPERILYPMRLTQAAIVELPDREQGLGWHIHILSEDTIPNLLNENVDNMLEPVSVRQFSEYPKFNGDDLIDKTGSTDGFRAYIAVIPNKKSGIAVMMNRKISGTTLVKMSREILFNLTGVSSTDEA